MAVVSPTRPDDLPSVADVLGRMSGENFPVAARFLPTRPRRLLLTIYGFARLTDQLGDGYAGDRLAALDWLEAELDLALLDPDRADLHPLVTGIATTARRLGIDPQPLRDLIQANRQDQVQSRYKTFDDLVGYCRLSANPVGRLVLAVFEVATPEREVWSDRICTALQLAEHWQDVGEDAAAGRVYLPEEDLDRFGVSDADLCAGHASPALRALLVFEVARARRWLDDGAPLIGDLSGRVRLAVAGFVAGGHAALDAIADTGFDPLGAPATPRPAGGAACLSAAQPATGGMNLDDAYDRCEAITSAEARNFSYGIKLLPTPKRRAMSALYAIARRIDDIGDGAEPAGRKLEDLSAVRKSVAAITRDPGAGGDDAVLIALADTACRFPIPMSALGELIDGCEMDVVGGEYDSFDDLVGYCRRVAGTVGRLSLAVYGCADPDAAVPLADDLGVALQITNILRDVREDRDQMGRVYLPSEDRRRFGVSPDLSGPPDGLLGLIAFEAGRAEEYYDRGLALLPMLDRRSRACTAAMAGIYRRLLTRIQRDPGAVWQGRLSLPGWQKAAVAARALTRGTA